MTDRKKQNASLRATLARVEVDARANAEVRQAALFPAGFADVAPIVRSAVAAAVTIERPLPANVIPFRPRGAIR